MQLCRACEHEAISFPQREKSIWYGKTVSVIGRFYPSSQLCSCRGTRNPDTRDMNVRSWVCPDCGTMHGRDVNAAANILNEGLRLLAQPQTYSRAGHVRTHTPGETM